MMAGEPGGTVADAAAGRGNATPAHVPSRGGVAWRYS